MTVANLLLKNKTKLILIKISQHSSLYNYDIEQKVTLTFSYILVNKIKNKSKL